MRGKGSWFSSVKKALSPDSKGKKKAKKAGKSKEKWSAKENPSVSDSHDTERIEVSHPHPLPPLEDQKAREVENQQTEYGHSVGVSTDEAEAEAEVVVSTADEIVQPTMVIRFSGKSMEEVAAIRIQTAFRGYLARRALRALKGLVRLKSLVDGPTAKRQTANTLKCMQNLSRVHAQIQSRRIRMSEENRTLQKQLLQKRAKELETLRMGEEWDQSLQSKEQIEASLLQKYEASLRRERALAYSYTHQQSWKKSAKSTNLLFMDPTNPHWGWSWLERWMSARPWETQSTADLNSDRLSVKSAATASAGGEITKSFARHQLNSDNASPQPISPKPISRHKPTTTPPPKAARKFNPSSPKTSVISQDDESKSVFSVQSERNRRHSIAGSSIRDDESLVSLSSVPSYMAPTRSAKAKSRLPSPLGAENGGNTPEKGSSTGVAKKRLSFPPSPAKPRRHSGPPKIETSSVIDGDVNGVIVT